MTTTSPRLMSLLLGVAACSGSLTCVFPDVGIGRACQTSGDCSLALVCVRLDPEKADEGNVCMPMLVLDAPQDCSDDEDCPAAGFPVDATCNDSRCTCGDAEDGFTCEALESDVVGEHTCRCLPSLLAPGDECEDDNQCVSERCGAGTCVEGAPGDSCDNDDDCATGPCKSDNVCE